MKNIEIRPAARDDTNIIKSIAEQTDLFPGEMLDDMMRGYFDKTAEDIWFVATLNNDVTGFGFCEPERMTDGTWNLLAIGVLPEHQGGGIGGQMMQYIETMLANKSARILLVETMGTPELEQTRQFYLQNKYTQEACIREFYEEGANKIIFWKKL